ncbi:leucyl aminopeptidase [Coprococcus comes]|uniref:Leucyl aminopeptidase n=1 Tax=Coprococcus comes TaxID=410072 RepID=A0A3E4GPS9_9FIRM|nr:aminopeptidase [Coprococcus comes]RGJ23204.1 leucyl aminopeptidase [Coprococcus comes]
MEERYNLAIDRMKAIIEEKTVAEPYREYFQHVARFILKLDELKQNVESGKQKEMSEEELQEEMKDLYADELEANYEKSYANPAYAVLVLGGELGSFLSAVYTEIRGSISYVQEQRMEYVVIGAELLIEIYNKFEEEKQPQLESLKEIFYWYASDYCDVFAADRIKDQIDPERGCFIVNMIMNEDLSDLRYLYRMGEYVGVNERETAAYLNSLSQEKIDKMADTFSEGYRIGFVNTGKDLSKKSVVNIYYAMGFERIVKKAIENFAKMGLKPSIFRTSHSVITRGRNSQIGFFNISGNKQYVYDHRDDIGLVMDKQYVERKLEVMRTTYEQNKEIAAGYAGPAVIDIFGEKTFVPQAKPEAVKLSEKQEELLVAMNGRAGRLTNEYLPGDERSFTIISWPVPEIGEQYHEIFDETIKINTLDYKLYQKVQQTMIDALDKGEYVKVTGSGENQTDLKVMLHPLADPTKETIFENCVADVNIPVGEVFTSPVLEGTEGTLFVSKVFLHGLPYYNLKISFKEGKITEYTCTNFDSEEENKKYIFDNILHNHQTLPIGEFAIGTNTTAYAVAKKYDIADKYTILIAEKTGPHFAVGDTCYSWAEDVKVYNPDRKEIIARDNSISILRKEDPSKAYFQCHTDITIPYDELGSIVVVAKDGTETEIIRDGRFVLPGTEILNEPLN